MKKARKVIASLAIAGMALTMVPFNVFATGAVGTRLAGITAAQTAVAIADQIGWTGTAVLASSTSYGMVDALTAGPLASYLKAPILLTGAGNVLDADTKAELVKLAVTKVYVTSGTAVISQAVLNELAAMKITVIALGGADRYETSVNIASKMVGVTKAAVANGLQDALSITAIAAASNQPILLTDKAELSASVKAYLAANPGITTSDIIGGTGIISEAVKAAVPSATRHAGSTAYDTNNQVIQDFATSLGFDQVYLANGRTGIDALAGAPLAAQTKSAIVLTDGVNVPAVAAFTFSKATTDSIVTALGGAAVVPEAVRVGVEKGPIIVTAVASVGALNTTGVDVVLPTVTEAKEGYTIEVKNPAGTVVPVKPINLEVGDAAVTFEFLTPLTSVTAGNWTVGGVTFDARKTTGTEAVAVKAVAEATNQVELNAALQDANFNRVNVKFIVKYDAVLEGTEATVAAIQADIDAVNFTQAAAAVTFAEAGLLSIRVTNAVALVDALKADVAPATDKKLLEDRLALHSAVIAVTEANTNAKLTVALNNLAKLSTELDLDSINSELLTNYRTAIAIETTVGDKNTALKIQGFITAVNSSGEKVAVTDLAGVTTAKTTAVEFTKKAQTLSDCSASFDIKTVISSLAEDYIAAIEAATNKHSALELQAIISVVNAPLSSVADLSKKAAGNDADALLASLKQVTLTLSNVVDANKAQYLVDQAKFAAAADATTPAEALLEIQKAVNASNAVVDLNAATSTTAVKAALSAFAVATENNSYINLIYTGKLEVAEFVLKAKATAGTPFATSNALTTEIASQMTARGVLIVAVNAAGPTEDNLISDMAAALDDLDYAPYENLSGVQKINVAEVFINGFPVAGNPPAQLNYTTVAAIKTAVDAAITIAN